ncbi:pseudouridine synthase [Paenibacillus aurantius]|uniref:Pseudouridine synthase n=1 Tax=Paenibacillus aurantius TaxID=2918900 RepID=A0AA96RBS1_9BACL|nr:pseudouridine synthase [Paenibacillus aurantius]WNQ09715.1 pseudouridine synthase [Paenibacillus aurantius]
MKATQRLDKLLAHSGFGTRSEIKALVKKGAVQVNGKVVKDSGIQVNPENEEVSVHGEVLRFREHVYLMLHKPAGVVSATEDNRDRTVLDLIGKEYAHFELFPVGRLDKDTEGLLLLTNDGKLAHQLLSPKKHVPKTYYAKVEGIMDGEDQRAFQKGVELDDGYVTLPAELVILSADLEENRSEIRLILHEGKFHQVKRMVAAAGKKVTYLKRTAMGMLPLDESLPKGGYRELTTEELEGLRKSHEV